MKGTNDIKRTARFERNPKLEALLAELNGLLSPVESARIRPAFDKPQWPPVLIMGCGRSGTTLLSEWLAASGLFGYPSNILSRFYEAPYIGALVQRMLVEPDLQFKSEFADVVPFGYGGQWGSEVGKTRGAAAPHVFWYFWRRFFPAQEIQYFNEAALARVDGGGLCSELAAMESAFGKPIAMKGMFVNWNIPFVHGLMPNAIFIHIKRHPYYTVQSILEAREKMYGNRHDWWSFKPPGYERLLELSPEEQVVNQVYLTCKAVDEGLAAIPEKNRLSIGYESFCRDPEGAYRSLLAKLSSNGYEVRAAYRGPTSIEARNADRLGGGARAGLFPLPRAGRR